MIYAYISIHIIHMTYLQIAIHYKPCWLGSPPKCIYEGANINQTHKACFIYAVRWRFQSQGSLVDGLLEGVEFSHRSISDVKVGVVFFVFLMYGFEGISLDKGG